MLSKTLSGGEVLEMVKKQLREEGLEFQSIVYNDLLDEGASLEIEVSVKPKPTPLHYPEGVRTPFPGPSLGGRGILDTPAVVADITPDAAERIRKSFQQAKAAKEGGSYIQTGRNPLRSTFANPGPDSITAALNDEHDIKLGGTA